MSFYGSIYYQAGEAITKVFIQNFGKNKNTFPNAVDDEVEIKADGRKGSFYLNSGNKWVVLDGSSENNLCTIYHSKPDETNLNQYVMPLEKADTPPADAQVINLSLADDIYLSSPAIYYDEAGHMIPTGQIMYFKIPKIDIQQGIDDLESRTKNLEITVNDSHEKRILDTENKTQGLDSALTTLRTNVGYRTDMTKNEDLSITRAIGNIDDMRTAIGDVDATLASKLAEIYLNYDSMNASYRALDGDIRDIKQRLDAGGL